MKNKFVVAARLAAVLVAVVSMWSSPSRAELVRAAYPSGNVQYLPAFVGLDRGFYKEEGLEVELISTRGATVAVQALMGGQIQFIMTIGPQMPAVWEGADIVVLAQQVGRPTFSLIVTPEIQKLADLKGKKIGVSFGGSTYSGIKALLELDKITDKDVEYVNIPGSSPKVAAMKQGIIVASLLAPPADYQAVKAGFKRLVNLADVFKDTAFTGLAATRKMTRENPQLVKRMVRAIVKSVHYTRTYPDDAIRAMVKHLKMDRDSSTDAYRMIRDALTPVPTEQGVELMAQWQAIALSTKPKKKPAEYMDLRFVNEAVVELGLK
jgi:ABC-type nitrate/sulfonate/bicarbonate transport system substrate-binding protein